MATYILVAMQMPVTIQCCALFCSCSLEFIGHDTVFFSHGKISSANISAAKSIRRTAQFADSCFAAFGRRCTLAGDRRFTPSRSSRRRKGARHSFPPHLNSPFIRTRMALPHCHTTVHRSPGVVRAKAKHTETSKALAADEKRPSGRRQAADKGPSKNNVEKGTRRTTKSGPVEFTRAFRGGSGNREWMATGQESRG